MNYKPYKHLPPFKGMVLQNFPFIEEDFDAITNYQLLCKVVEYLKNVIANELTMEENVTNLYNSFVELKNYVDNYFDNLDVQEEINNKLDDMAESGELEEIIGHYLTKFTEECKFIFPKNWINGNDGAGDTSLIICENKSILIDTSYEPMKSKLYTLLNEYNVTHLDYIVISHYDIDHCGNFISLINDGYIDNETTIYLPPYVNYLANVPNALLNYTNIMNKLSAENLSYIIPTENVSIEITTSLKFKFFNCDADFLNNTGWIRYNNYSMILLAEHQNNSILYTGDCNKEPLERLINNNFITRNIDLYKIEHHGQEYGMNYTPILLLKNIKPRYAFLPANTALKNGTCNSITISYLESYGTNISAQYDNLENVIYTSCFNSLTLKGKVTPNISNATSTITYYVDIDTENTIRNGSQTYPFKTLREALGKVNKNEYATINLTNGVYDSGARPFILNNINVTINGNSNDNTLVELNNILYCYNSKLILKNLTLSNNLNSANILSYDSKIYANNCIITGDETLETKIGTGIDGTDSDIHIFSSEIKNLSVGIDNRNSQTFISNSSYENVTTANIIRNGIHNISGNNTFANVTTRNNITSVNSILNENNTTLYSGSAEGTQTITLSDDITQYNHLIIQIGAYNTGEWTQYELDSHNSMFQVNDIFTLPSIQGYGTMTVATSNTITLNMPLNAYIRVIKGTRKIR